MVEQSRIKENNVRVPPFVVGMAAPALRGSNFGAQAMEARVRG